MELSVIFHGKLGVVLCHAQLKIIWIEAALRSVQLGENARDRALIIIFPYIQVACRVIEIFFRRDFPLNQPFQVGWYRFFAITFTIKVHHFYLRLILL